MQFVYHYTFLKGKVSPLKWHKFYCYIMFLSKVMSNLYGWVIQIFYNYKIYNFYNYNYNFVNYALKVLYNFEMLWFFHMYQLLWLVESLKDVECRLLNRLKKSGLSVHNTSAMLALQQTWLIMRQKSRFQENSLKPSQFCKRTSLFTFLGSSSFLAQYLSYPPNLHR